MRTKLAATLAALALLGGCTTRHPAPIVDRTPQRAGQPAPAAPASAASPAAAPLQDGSFYTVKRGDTLYSIALDNGADYREVAQWNGLDDPSKIRVGQVLRVKAPPEAAVQVGRARVVGGVEARPLEPVVVPPVSTLPPPVASLPPVSALPPTVAKPKPVPLASQGADDGSFIWPLKGKLLAGFAEPRSKGIDIDGRAGDPVLAAAPGRVTYIGSGIPGLGKLVVLKHDSGFITVYAHNRDIMVKEQQLVARGQKIAEVGSTDADRPKLHFQIRKGAAAVDPLRYLPAL